MPASLSSIPPELKLEILEIVAYQGDVNDFLSLTSVNKSFHGLYSSEKYKEKLLDKLFRVCFEGSHGPMLAVAYFVLYMKGWEYDHPAMQSKKLKDSTGCRSFTHVPVQTAIHILALIDKGFITMDAFFAKHHYRVARKARELVEPICAEHHFCLTLLGMLFHNNPLATFKDVAVGTVLYTLLWNFTQPDVLYTEYEDLALLQELENSDLHEEVCRIVRLKVSREDVFNVIECHTLGDIVKELRGPSPLMWQVVAGDGISAFEI